MQQLKLLKFVLDRARGIGSPPPPLTLVQLQQAGFATGLTALAAELAAVDFAAELQPYLLHQQAQVAERVQRFGPVIGRVLSALAEVDVPATPVKGAELVNGIWPYPTARPMSDVDVVVPVELRAQATASLIAAGFTFDGASPHEDTFLAWGDGSVGRTDGESADHNGRVELHPGWNEFIHGYIVDGLSIEDHATVRPLNGADCARLDLAAVTTSVIGHLSSTVVRCEVRALNVVDVWFCHAAGVEWPAVGRLLDECDPRLTGPGLWMLARLLPEMVPAEIFERQVARLPAAARRRLDRAEPETTLRDAASRTTLGWRQAFTMRPGERVAVLRQMAQSARVHR